jgi:hypothetical protein
MSKLTVFDHSVIRRMVRFDGVAQKKVAELYRVSQATISYIVNAKPKQSMSAHRRERQTEKAAVHLNRGHGAFHGNSSEFVEPWAPKVRGEPLPLPVKESGFIKPPTREQLMGRR